MLSCWLVCLWFFCVLILPHIPASLALSYTSTPHNVSQMSGKAASFLCGISPETATTTVLFTIHHCRGNQSVQCPGEPNYLPSLGLNGYCEVEGQELRAVWSMAYISQRDDATYVVCQPTGLRATYAYLSVKGNNSYFYALIGCAAGGFLGILLIFGLAYLGLKRSERCRQCFNGYTSEDDTSAIIEQ